MKFVLKQKIIQSLLVTLALVAFYRLGALIPLPFLDIARCQKFFGSNFPPNAMNERYSIFMLNIMPYISAYFLVEFFSLFIPFLKRLRQGGFKGRVKLKRIALVFTSATAIWQANTIISDLLCLNMPDGQPILVVSNAFEHMILISVLVGSFYLLLILCELITRFGIGHGISIILFCGLCAGFIDQISMYFQRFDDFGLFSFLIAAIAFTGILFFACVFFKIKIPIPCYHEKNNATVNFFQLNLSPSSTDTLLFTSTLIVLPIILEQFFGKENGFANSLAPSSFLYNLASIFFVFVLSYLFCWAFLHPHKRVEKMRSWGWRFANIDTTPEKYMLKKQFFYNLPWAIYLCLLIVLPSILISSVNMPFYIGGASIPLFTAILFDLSGGFKYYKKNLHRPIKIAEFHDIYDATMIQNHMEDMGIKSLLRGYHHRLLSYFFGPYLEISLIVDDKDKGRAQMLIEDFYGGIGLTMTA